MNFRKKLAASMLATSMLATSFSVVGPVSTEFLVQKVEAAQDDYITKLKTVWTNLDSVESVNTARKNAEDLKKLNDSQLEGILFGTDKAAAQNVYSKLEAKLTSAGLLNTTDSRYSTGQAYFYSVIRDGVLSHMSANNDQDSPMYIDKVVSNFRNYYGSDFDKIFGTEATVDRIFEIIGKTEEKSRAALDIKELATSLLDGTKTPGQIKEDMKTTFKDSLIAALNEVDGKNGVPAGTFKGKLGEIGLSIDLVTNMAINLQNEIDPDNAALIALSVAYNKAYPKQTTGGGGGGGGTPATNNPTTETGKNVQDVLKDTNKTDQQKAEAIKEAVSKFVEGIKNVQDPTKAAEAAKNAVDVVKNLGEALKAIKDDAAKKEIVANVVATLEASTKLLANATPEQTASLFVSYAQELKAVVGAVDAKAAAEIKQAVLDMAKAAVERASTQQVEAGAIADQAVTDAIAKAKDAVAKVNGALKDNGLGTGSEFKATVAFEIKGNKAEAALSFTVSSVAKFVSENVANVSIKFGNGLKGKIDFAGLTGAKFVMAATDEAGKKDVPAGEVKIEANKLADKAPGANQQSVSVPAYQVNISVDGKQVDAVAKAVELSFDVPALAKGVNAEKLGAFKEENGKWIPVGGRYDTATGTYTVKAKQTGVYTVYLSTKTFADVANVAWAKDAVEVMVAKGVLNGITEDKFAPNSDVTRAQFARMLVQTLGLSDASVDGATTFKDVKENDWFAKDVKIAASLGIVAGVKEDTFAPNAPITREQMAAMVARALKNISNVQAGNTADALKKFKDANKISGWASEGVALVAEKGIVNGMSNSTFAPQEKASRAQAAVIMYKVFNVK